MNKSYLHTAAPTSEKKLVFTSETCAPQVKTQRLNKSTTHKNHSDLTLPEAEQVDPVGNLYRDDADDNDRVTGVMSTSPALPEALPEVAENSPAKLISGESTIFHRGDERFRGDKIASRARGTAPCVGAGTDPRLERDNRGGRNASPTGERVVTGDRVDHVGSRLAPGAAGHRRRRRALPALRVGESAEERSALPSLQPSSRGAS